MEKSSLGDRMKGYENAFRHYLPRRMPCIIRLDGVAFHTYTRNCKKPFDPDLNEKFSNVAHSLIENIQGCKLAYWQSDEISLLLIDYDNHFTEAWFGKNIQKICSVSASIATACFNKISAADAPVAFFDARAFVLPKEEVCNYFIWRQKDCERNSINSLAQSLFSHNELQKVSVQELHDKLFIEKGINWNDLPSIQKRGGCIYRDNETDYRLRNDSDIPIFSQHREYIERHVFLKEGEIE